LTIAVKLWLYLQPRSDFLSVLVTKSISRWGVRRFVVLKAICLNVLGVVDPALSDLPGDRLYLLDGFEGKRVAAPLELRDESKDEPFTLYASTTVVASSWRELLLSAKSAPNEIIRQFSVRRLNLLETFLHLTLRVEAVPDQEDRCLGHPSPMFHNHL
jgi:hypothetical protein